MKSLKYTALLLLIIGSSCNKFLEEHPQTFVTPETPLTSFKDARAVVDAGYDKLHGVLAGEPSSYGCNTYNLLEFLTGKAGSDLGQTGYAFNNNLSYTNESFYVNTWWQQMYLGVGAATLRWSRSRVSRQPV